MKIIGNFKVQRANSANWLIRHNIFQAHSEPSGKAMPALDGLIAATGIAYDLAVVTRSITDMEISGVTLINPW